MIRVHQAARPLAKFKIGNREVVGPSITGLDDYYDQADNPCPPIRYRPPSAEFDALREKEKGDWKNLTIDEKKKLYRFNFRQTIKEVEAPTAHGRRIIGNVLMLLCVPLLVYVAAKKTVFPPLPETMSDQGKKNVVRFYIDAHVDPIGGISSKWDYEKNQWKEKPYLLMKKD